MTTLTVDFDARVGDVPDDRLRRLRVLNAVFGVVHLISGTAMIVLGDTSFELPTSTFALDGPPGTPLADGTIDSVLGVPLAVGTAAFAYLSALFHLVIASPVGFGSYSSELRRGRNRWRWVEYSLSATLMIVLIALITGITDVAALIAIGFANVSMILFGWIMEMVNTPDGSTWWTPFWFGCIAGIGPWLAIVAYLVINVNRDGAEGPPTFVYGIIVTIFLLFNCFALNQWLQYREVGRWSDYVFGEVVYVVLSLVAKSALAWQIFANTLIPPE
ncbi:heliorhodopsin HeR [Ilumatobacter sp.]|uniref:heliorhodopsin HeR n=1 Tax=Ilumatobacter sp. TaxID=1967498 RepID=UPI003B524300